MRVTFLYGSVFLVLCLTVTGCGKPQPPAAPSSSAAVQAEETLPELAQNKIEPFNVFTPSNSSQVQVFEDHDDDIPKLSEEEKQLAFPPATD